jgi:hypothetical protein
LAEVVEKKGTDEVQEEVNELGLWLGFRVAWNRDRAECLNRSRFRFLIHGPTVPRLFSRSYL